MNKGMKMHNSVMRLTISNKKIINYMPHIVTSIILLILCQQLAQLTWKIILPVNFTDNALSPADMTAPAARSPETALPRFTLFGLAEKTSASAHGGNLHQAPVSALKLRVTGLLASTDPYLRGSARPAGSDVLGCGPVPSYLRDHLRSDEVGPDSEHAAEVLQHALQLIALPQQPLSAPMAVLNGTEDQVIPAEWVEESVRASCALDGQIQHVELLQATHSSGFPYGDIEEWLGKRFTGDPPESNCGQ